MFVTLDEAAEYLTRVLDDSELSAPVTAAQVLRYGMSGALPMCMLLDKKAYSPSKLRNMQEAAKAANPEGWALEDNSGPEFTNAALKEAYGLFLIPPRCLFALETRDRVLVEIAFSLDGMESVCPVEYISRKDIRITLRHLNLFAKNVQPSGAETGEEKPAQRPEEVGENTEDWVTVARRFATEVWKSRPRNTNPNKSHVAEQVRKRLVEAGIFGPRGPLSASTIERHALRDWNKPKG